MGRKRFTLDCIGIFDDEKNKYIFDDEFKELVDLLNDLSEENEKLEKKVKKLESTLANDIVRKSEIKEIWKQRTEKKVIDV